MLVHIPEANTEEAFEVDFETNEQIYNGYWVSNFFFFTD